MDDRRVKVIGKGGYGTIFSVIGSENKQIAVKILDIDDFGIKSLMEVSIMSVYRHPALTYATQIMIIGNKLHIQQDIADCDMRDYLVKVGYKTKEEIFSHLSMICSGIKFLHDASIVHGDVKPQNILIYGDKVKLCDFGCSVIIKGDHTRSDSGTIRYNAPEILISSKVSFPSDIWSLGCVLYEMMTGKTLIPNIGRGKERKLVTAKIIQEWRIEEGDEVADKLPYMLIQPVIFNNNSENLLIKSMTNYKPEYRPTIDKVINICKFDTVCNVDVICKVVLEDIYIKNSAILLNYVKNLKISVDSHVLSKAVEILCVSQNTTLEYVEACLLMSFNMHQIKIEHTMVTSAEKLKQTVLEICMLVQFRVHKFSTNNLYIDINV